VEVACSVEELRLLELILVSNPIPLTLDDALTRRPDAGATLSHFAQRALVSFLR
jgi:hypothetical protein